MAKEIERKFLIKRELWQPQSPGVEIRQGYLSLDPERTVRVRTKGAKGYLTIKGKNQGISRTELEYEIPYEEASQMLEELCLRPLVEKTRYLEQHGQQLWEIDIFAEIMKVWLWQRQSFPQRIRLWLCLFGLTGRFLGRLGITIPA